MAILKKLKKGLKKAAKVAIPVGAALLAARALKRRNTDTGLSGTSDYSPNKDDGFLASGAAGGASLAKQDRQAKAIKAMTSNDAYSDDTKPSNLGTMRSRRGTVLGKLGINRFDDGNMYQGAKDGGRIGKKSGGKVRGCGIAKRGLGRAMKKGKR
jgi:hypothetical protein